MLPKVILVDIIQPETTPEESMARLNELESLLLTYGGFVIIRKIQKKQMPDYQTYIGKGKVEEILEEALEKKANYIIVNNLLKPQQIYNLEKRFEKHQIEVWDRVDLILKIFAKHATTKEAKMQIELASLRHLGPRISKMGLELTRQGGGGTSGGGARRGQGETNIEIMKRHIARREQKICSDLKKIESNQKSQRKARKNHGFKTVAIVGYTNAGKSALLKALTKKEVKVKDELFATLDSRIGKLYLPETQQSCLLSDTIGFIRDLPPELIHAFHSTLAETIEADLLLHVIDINDFEMITKINAVNQVLKELNCDKKKMIYVFNKIDLMDEKDLKNGITNLKSEIRNYSPVFVSALEKANLEELKTAITKNLY
ncbi:GTPase HflX [Candidatus Peregrinibacteria bacterium]|nr:GTPase HflX [Candidatus Peregrinibacteria bacterium]